MSYADLNLAAIPISFSLSQSHLESVAKAPPKEVARFLAHIKSEEAITSSSASDYVYSVFVNFDVVKKAANGAVPIRLAGPGEVAQISVALDDNKLPPGIAWRHSDLVKALKNRYSNFCQDRRYFKIKATLEKSKKLCHERYLIPGVKSSSKVKFYNPNIIWEFDKHYLKKDSETKPAVPTESDITLLTTAGRSSVNVGLAPRFGSFYRPWAERQRML